jgi:hypothetical protein
MNTYNFGKMAKIGKWAVDRLTDHYDALGYTVINVEDDDFYRSLDIDLVVQGELVSKDYVEVKGDTYKSGNIYIETVANVNKNSPGCLKYTGADYIAYYMVALGFCLMIPVPELKHWIEQNESKYEQKRVQSKFDNGYKFGSRGIAVPIKTILEQVPGTHKIEGLPVLAGREKGEK